MRHRFGIWLVFGALALFLFAGCAARELLPREMGAPLSLTVATQGQKPTASDFLSPDARDFCERQGIAVDFSSPPNFDALGTHIATLRLTQEGATQELAVRYTVIADETPPTFYGVKEQSILIGEGLTLYAGVSVQDDCFGNVDWRVDASMIDTSRAGLYSAIYTACDASGNERAVTVYVHVHETAVTEGMLAAVVDPLLLTLITPDDGIEARCRAIHAYVQSSIDYFPISDKTDPTRAAYDALAGSRRGDCFTYYATARALLQAAGVETLTLERTHDIGEETHIWLMVNLAPAGEAPRWYHFDPTPVQEGGVEGGCLFTDAQLNEYNQNIRPGFYDHDATMRPATPTEQP